MVEQVIDKVLMGMLRKGLDQLKNVLCCVLAGYEITEKCTELPKMDDSSTNILNKGMPIEEVKELLGHVQLDTTLIYCKRLIKQRILKISQFLYNNDKNCEIFFRGCGMQAFYPTLHQSSLR